MKLSDAERLILLVALVIAALIVADEIRRWHARELAQREAMFEQRMASRMAQHQESQAALVARIEAAESAPVEQHSDRAFNAWIAVGVLSATLASDWAQVAFLNR